jgi:uncharacterized protein
MELLIKKSEQKAQAQRGKYRRYLYHEIQWEQKLVLLLGHRGVGKTTLLLQHLQSTPENGIYLSLDDFYFETNRLIELIPKLYESGFRRFYLDEVHRYEFWSKDLKMLYDDFEDIKIAATGSSILDISKGNEDLSRRALVYHLPGLSFREFLLFEGVGDFESYPLSQILSHHADISTALSDQFNFEPHFNQYLKLGYYPFFLEGKQAYQSKLQQVTRQVIESDIAPFEDLNYSTVRNMKKLLYIISTSAPFAPNIAKLAERIGTPRNTLLRLLDLMEQAKILQLLRSSSRGISYLQKPEKVYLENPNLAYLFADDSPNRGSLRETFFYNQLHVKHEVSSAKYGDFLVDEQYTFEIGGPSKTPQQIKGIANAYLAIDQIAGGAGRNVPLWLFGFTY